MVKKNLPYRIGTAGWSIPSQIRHLFMTEGSHLQRYARVFNCVEINSSFYRDHKPDTYARWAASTPTDFHFSIKLSRHFTQDTGLEDIGLKLQETLASISQLKNKWGALLVQLPPRLEFSEKMAGCFLQELRQHFFGVVLWEPRHPSWGKKEAIELLNQFNISKVLADPEPCLVDKNLRTLVESDRYYRLHGTPNIYKSRYSKEIISRLADRLLHPDDLPKSTWVIFDNTTYGYATENALELQKLVQLKCESQLSL